MATYKKPALRAGYGSLLQLAAGAAISLTWGPAAYAEGEEAAQGRTPASVAPAPSDPGSGSPPGGDVLEEISVTARRSTEALMTVPAAVTALSAATLASNHVSSLTEIPNLAPFVSIEKTPTGTGALFSIRGIGSPTGDVGVQQTVLINIDNVLIGRGRIVNQALFDLSEVEVLKGPQALFYGKNSPAGVVSVTTAGPGTAWGGYLRTGYEFETHQRFVDGAVDIPLSSEFAVRLAGHSSKSDGFIENQAVAEPNPFAPAFPLTGAAHTTLGGETDDVARLTAKWTPADSFTATFKYTQGRSENDGEDSPYEVFCKPGLTHPTDFGVPDLQSDCRFDGKVAFGSFPQGLTVGMNDANGGRQYGRMNYALSSLALSYIGESYTLNSVTGYYRLDSKSSGVFDGTSYANIYVVSPETADSVSEEVRLSSNYHGPLNYTVGAYVDSSTDDNLSEALLAFVGPDPATGKYYTYDRMARVATRTRSVFVQGRWDIVDDLELAAGARYTHESKDSVDGITYLNASPAFAGLRPAGDLFVRTYDGNNVSPEATLTWHPTADQTLYGAYKTGYKSGGFSYPSVLTANLTAADTTFRPEKARGGEVGYKAYLFEHRVSAELTAYQYTFNDLQVSSFDAANLSFIVGNAAKARTRGVEFQSRARILGGLNIDGSVGYNQAEYTSFPTAACYHGQTVAQGCNGFSQDLSGRTLPRAPHVQANVGVVYERGIGANLKFNVNGRVSYSGQYNAQDTLDPNTMQKSFWKFDAGAGIATEDDRWTLSVIGRNLSNEYVLIFSQDKARGLAGEFNGVPGQPREVLLQAGFKY